MTGGRIHPWVSRMQGTGFVIGQDFDIMASISDSWPEMAKVHSEGRNSVVAWILAWSVVIRHLHSVKSVRFAAAEFQISRSVKPDYKVPAEWAKRMDEYKLGKKEREEFSDKCCSTQDAHRAPCAILLNGLSLDAFLASPGSRQDTPAFGMGIVGGMFGATDRLPSIFNESDSHVEKVGFKEALLSACLNIPSDRTSLTAGLFEERLRRAYVHWNSRATKACDLAIERNRERLAVAVKKKDGAERIYREAKIQLIEYYRTHTATNIPYIFEPEGMYMAYEIVSEIL